MAKQNFPCIFKAHAGTTKFKQVLCPAKDKRPCCSVRAVGLLDNSVFMEVRKGCMKSDAKNCTVGRCRIRSRKMSKRCWRSQSHQWIFKAIETELGGRLQVQQGLCQVTRQQRASGGLFGQCCTNRRIRFVTEPRSLPAAASMRCIKGTAGRRAWRGRLVLVVQGLLPIKRRIHHPVASRSTVPIGR
jgi:hypothetical protein